MALRVMEPQEPYNTKEDLLELADAYKEIQQRIEKDNFALSRLAQEAAKKYDLKEFARLTGENYNNLKQLSYVAGRYEEYTQYTLTFRHYMVAAKSDKRLEWLQKAQDNAWSAERLRREMNPPAPKKAIARAKVDTLAPKPERKIEPEVVKPRVDPYGPVLPTDPREEGITIYEAAAALNYNLGQNPGEIRPWVEFYVAIVNNLFNQKTEKRMEFMMEEFVIV